MITTTIRIKKLTIQRYRVVTARLQKIIRPHADIIFLRSNNDQIDIFEVALFHKRYHRSTLLESGETEEEQIQERYNEENIPSSSAEVVSDTDDIDETNNFRSLSDNEKYKMIMSKLIKIGNLISAHNTTDFYNYLDDLENWEKSIRKGMRLHKHSLVSNNVGSQNESSDNIGPALQCHQVSLNSNTVDPSPLVSPEQRPLNSDTVSPSPSRFQGILFKEQLKIKGRPKKRSKQVSFRKTSIMI